MERPPREVPVMLRTEGGFVTGLLANATSLNDLAATQDDYFLLDGRLRARPPRAVHGNQTTKFRYKPLQPETKEIRLLHIYTDSTGASEIRCQIRHVNLDSPPDYIALSYTWGKDPPVFSILCDWKSFNVTSNLYSALLRLRDGEDHPKHVWVDAICINQDDVEEKNLQVPMMREIYQKAKSVHVWLGEAQSDTNLVDKFMRQMYKAERAKTQANDRRLFPQLSESIRQRYGFPPISDPGYRAFANFLDSPWCQRTWIVQEVAVASALTMHRGDYSFPGEVIISVARCIIQNAIEAELPFKNISREFTMNCVEYTRFQSGQEIKLLAALLRHRTCLLTCLQDRVYALRNIASDVGPGKKLSIPVDYGLDAEAVFIATAKEIIAADNNLNILSAVGVSVEQNPKDFPSWVPNWTSCQHDTFIWREAEYEYQHSAYLRSDATNGTQALPRFQGDRLVLSGHIIGSVVLSGAEFTKENILPPYPSWEWLAEARSKKKYFTGEAMLDVFYQTITMGTYLGTREEFLTACSGYDRRWNPLRRLADMRVSATTRLLGKTYEKLLTATRMHPLSRSIMTAYNRKLARTDHNLLALIPGHAEDGDVIALCRGGRVPLILREVEGVWRLVGDCYIHGIMDGSMFEEERCETLVIC